MLIDALYRDIEKDYVATVLFESDKEFYEVRRKLFSKSKTFHDKEVIPLPGGLRAAFTPEEFDILRLVQEEMK